MKKKTDIRFVLLILLSVYLPGLFAACGNVEDITCPVYEEQVCGSDGRTYQNYCFAEFSGIYEYLNGACPYTPCAGPVCGSDCNTYVYDCFAALLNALPFSDGECAVDCVPQ